MSVKTTLLDVSNLDYFKPLAPEMRFNSADIMIGAINDEGKACGILLARIGSDILEHTYMYVSESDRGIGAESELLDMLEGLCRDIGFAGITFSIAEGDESPYQFQLAKLLRERGYEELKDQGAIYSFKLSDVSSRISNFRAPVDVEVKSLRVSKARELEQLLHITNQVKNTEFAEDLPYIYSYENYDEETSQLMLFHGEAIGCLLVSETSFRPILDYFFVARETSPFDVMALLSSGLKACKEKYGENSEILVNAINDKIAKQICKYTDNQAVKVATAVSFCLEL